MLRKSSETVIKVKNLSLRVFWYHKFSFPRMIGKSEARVGFSVRDSSWTLNKHDQNISVSKISFYDDSVTCRKKS